MAPLPSSSSTSPPALRWDVIMAPLPDVFRSPFQTAPLDLATDAFYPSRRSLVDDCLQV